MFSKAIENVRRQLFDRCVLRPSRTPIDFGDKQRIVFAAGGYELETFFQSNVSADLGGQNPDLLVIKFPGTAGRAERATRFPMDFLPDVRASLWTWNPPGYGGSSGRASLRRIAEAATIVCEKIMERCRARTVWLCGNSLGCATSMHVASSARFRELASSGSVGLLQRNPPALKEVFRRVANQYPLGSLTHPWAETLPESMNTLVSATELDVPAVFMHSELDELVPLPLQERIVANYSGPAKSIVLSGLGHGGVATDEHQTLIAESIQWLWDQTREPSH